ncbi:amidohydrolase [Pseudohaliea sp.]|uniref:amidohydrolase n=1 Tax=Pseudohaliea sp. TaxID=2740289 RepID=UPI0032EAAC2D
MKPFDRRTFTRGLAAAGVTAAAGPGFAAASWGKADLVVLGGTIYSMDPVQPKPEAFAVRGNRILAVGSADAIRDLAGPATEVVDARGLTVTPGFIDAHSHPLAANEVVSANVDLRSIAAIQQALRARAARTKTGTWVLGHMYDDTKLAEGRPLSRRDLDAVSTEHPIFVRHRGGHTAVVNSRALDIAGITLDTPDPEGGKFYREDGAFTGKVAEHAVDVFEAAGDWPAVDRAGHAENAALITRRMAESGLTSTTDAWGDATGWQAYNDAYRDGRLALRVSFMPGGRNEIYTAMKAARLHSGFGDAMLRVGAVKYGADGSASERTMAMSTPYQGRPDDYGILTMRMEEIDAAVDDAVAHGFRIGIHANGDVAIDRVLSAYERVLAGWEGRNPRFRIEHCSLVNPSLLERIKATGAVPTPFYTYAHYHGNKWGDYGEEKMQRMFAHRSFLDYDIPVAPASDFTPGPYQPLMAIQSMVTRKDFQGRVWGPKQRISVAEALRICTVHGAYASFEEELKGSITPGKLADFVLLGDDPHTAEPDRIKDIPVLRTVMDGRTTFEA